MSHDEIQHIAAKWLKNHKRNAVIPNCTTVVENLVTLNGSGEVPDVMGWNYSYSVLIEVKTSKSDFNNEKKKYHRQRPELSMGQFRYYCCPCGIINEDDLPKHWGLLYINQKNKIEVVKIAEKQDSNLDAERSMLLSIIRRLRNGKNKLV